MQIPSRSDQTLAVFGLGASGAATAAALSESGARVIAWDDQPGSRDKAAASGVALDDPDRWDWAALSALVLSPGIPLTHPEPHAVVKKARAASCPVIGDIELLSEAAPDARKVGITGTNGKSTTTALLGHILREAGLEIAIGGNLGPPALGLPTLGADGIYVLELSSYQLDLIDRARFDIALLLNVSADHLDRHGDMDGYVAAKKRIFRDRPSGNQVAIIGTDDEQCRAVLAEMQTRDGWEVVPVGVGHGVENGVYVIDGKLHDARLGDDPIADLGGIGTLPGAHNHQNVAAAYAACRALGLAIETITAALGSYPGLPHRQETVAVIDGVRYVNDSKATNGEAALTAFVCYDDIYWIAGGRAKADGLDALIGEMSRVRCAYLIGEAEEPFTAQIGDKAPVRRCGTLAKAIAAAHQDAQRDSRAGATVLLSPACASFDQWPSFGARGDAFRAAVLKLAAEAGA